MQPTESVFFVFSQKNVEQIAASPSLLNDVDCVISVLPGISLDGLPSATKYVTLEQALEDFKITQRSISRHESAYTHALLHPEIMADVMPVLGATRDDSIRLALLNHIALLTHDAFSFDLLFRALVNNGLRKARCCGFYGTYRMVERLDIRTLLNVDLSFVPQLIHLCSQADVDLAIVGKGDRLGIIKNTLREVLLLGYKFKTLLQRSWRIQNNPAADKKIDAAFIVRARTEVASAEPILHWRAQNGYNDVMLVDDLIKSPDGTAAASASGRDWKPLHAYMPTRKLVTTFLWCALRQNTAATRAISRQPQRVETWGFLGQPNIAKQVLRTAFSSVPELLIHRFQLERAFDQLKPNEVVSFDTVDRWGAVQGEIARLRQIRSVMIQNTSVDDIIYPRPLPMDHFVVANSHVRELFLMSGADSVRVHAFGLPVQDSELTNGHARLKGLCQLAMSGQNPLRIMIATQPFVQEFDYNSALIDDLEEALKGIFFPVELILKPHPREYKEKYRKIVESLSFQNLNVTQFDGPLEAALDLTDILLSRTSTSLEFAALGGVPGISHLCQYPRDILTRLGYLKNPVTSKTFNMEDLRLVIEGFAPDRRLDTLKDFYARRARFLEEFFPGEGLATQRVTELMTSDPAQC